jgi:hypothetical protein
VHSNAAHPAGARRARHDRSRRGARLAATSLAHLATLALAVVAGCGDDEEATPAARPAARPNTPAVPSGPGGAKNQLVEKQHIEDRVSCPPPEKPTDPKDGVCDPKAPSCPEHTYCIAFPTGSAYCEPCPERDRIRHAFKERDFAVEQNRDPFQSFLLPQVGLGKPLEGVPIDPTKKCLREDQMVATSYSYADLRLVGIVAQGTQRKVLMMGGPLGYIIKRGDCVGKEKAVVKDIGTGYITFQVDPDQSSARTPEEYSVQLNPKQLIVNEPELPTPAPRTTIAPVVPPPTTLPPRAAPGGAGAAAGAGAGAGAVPPAESPAVPPGQIAPVQAPAVAPPASVAPKRSYVPAPAKK